MLPKVPASYSQERRGVIALQAYAADHGQIWREISSPDIGIDGHLEYVDAKGFATGRLVGVQIKSGPSYFVSRSANGWKFYPEDKHRTYWERYPVPVLLVLHNPQSGQSYWMDARQALRSPATQTDSFLLVLESNTLQTTTPLDLLETAGVAREPFIDGMDNLIDALVLRRSSEADFPVSFLDLFAGGLTNICRSLYFGTDVADTASEANLLLSGWDGPRTFKPDFLFEFIQFLVAQHIADVNFSDCLIDWLDREMVPHFVAPLTSRGRALVDALHVKERELIAAEKLESGDGLLVAQEGFFGMHLESYHRRLPRIYAFQEALRKPS
jgi:hypothetical protein